MPSSHSEILQTWVTHDDVHLPRTCLYSLIRKCSWNPLADIRKPSIYQFERDEGGFPKLPILDLDEVSLKQIGELLTLYLAMVWGTSPSAPCPRHHPPSSVPLTAVIDHGYPSENSMPGIPWSEVTRDPAGHYNVEAYTFGCLIGNPTPCKLIDAPALYDALFEYQKAGTPFRFLTKAEYLSRAQAAAQ